ncbi:MAG: hypothetical protein IJ041_04930 [Clostridia bacterium]|nr:hypothetical protein [Clostridia bacterium]
MKHLLMLMAFLFFLMLVVSGVMAVGNVKQSEQMAQRIQQVSGLKAELRKAEQRQQELTRELAGWRSRSATLRAGQAAVSRRLGDMLQLTRSVPTDSVDLRAAFAATEAASGGSTAAWLPDISGAMVSKAILPPQGEELLRLTALENMLRRLIDRKTGEADSWNAVIAERDTAITERDTAITERDAAITERDTSIAARDTAITERDTAITERDTAITERDTAITERDTVITERDAAIAARDTAVTERDAAIAARDTAVAERDTAITERDTAVLERDTAITHRNALLIQRATAAFIETTAVSIKDRLSLLPRPAAAPASAPAPALPDGQFIPTDPGKNSALSQTIQIDPPAAVLAVFRRVSAEVAGRLCRLLKPLQDQLSRIANGLLEFHHP